MRPSSAPHVLIVGSSNTDLVLSCRHLPRPGETLLGGDFQRFHGGKGANQAVAAARAGGKIIFVGCRGDDDFGRAAFEALKNEGIEVNRFLIKKRISSGVALILVGGKERENLIGVARSANDLLAPRDVQSAEREFSKAGVVVTQLETPLPAVMESARLASRFGVPFLLNPAPARSLPVSLLKWVHTLTPNEHEAEAMTGEENPQRAGEQLLRKGCRQVVVTLGARGALLVDENGARLFPAPKVKPVDTVGAGDCFTGWLAVSIAEKLPISNAIKKALCAASLSVTRPGAQASMPFRLEVEKQLKRDRH